MSRKIPNQLMQLSYPQHVAEFRTYEDAQAAVDYLADKRFAVQNILIVGTNL
jgi:FtsZ-interacting cell division protein YlmF